ncbi:MAG TPA: phosphodiester glycosidase family protein [Bacilli bacterium]
MFIKIQLAFLSSLLIFAGFLAAFYIHNPELEKHAAKTAMSYEPVNQKLPALDETVRGLGENDQVMQAASNAAKDNFAAMNAILADLIGKANAEKMQDEAQTKIVDAAVKESEQHARETNDVLDTILSNILGEPIGQTFGDRAIIKVFSLKEAGYRGYMAKVKLRDPNAVKLVLSHDKIGDKGETTSHAAKRTNAVLAINGGGFAVSKGLLYPMGITVVDGIIKTFYSTDLSFIGFNDHGNLVGGKISRKEQIEKLHVRQGASFVPTLLKDGKKQTIPSKWRNKKEPRTLIGHFSNGDLLFIVIDGRQEGYSEGVTLEEAQDKLLEFNVRDAYNLDGGGSSTFYYNGKVLNSPSDGHERLLASSFVVFK